jgi:hypothetical protein
MDYAVVHGLTSSARPCGEQCRLLIDRLARSAFDLFGIEKQIVDAKAQFRSSAGPWADKPAPAPDDCCSRCWAAWPTWSTI